MPQTLTQQDLDHVRQLHSNGKLVELYDYLQNRGYQYATLALGVVNGDEFAGFLALEFLQNTVGRALSENELRGVRLAMADEYIATLQTQLNDDRDHLVRRDVTADEAWDFHSRAFNTLGYGADAWTLNTPFARMTDEERQSIWDQVLANPNDVLGTAWSGIKTAFAAADLDMSSDRPSWWDWFGRIWDMDNLVDGFVPDVWEELGVALGFDVGPTLDNGEAIHPLVAYYHLQLAALMDPSINRDRVEQIVGASSPIPRQGLEGFLRTFELIFGLADAPVADSEAYYARVGGLIDYVRGRVDAGDVFRLRQPSADSAQMDDAAGLAHRFGLAHLLPFVVLTTDASGVVNDAATEALYATHASELELYDAETGQGVLTAEWIELRMQMLTVQGYVNTHDRADSVADVSLGIISIPVVRRLGDVIFSDEASGTTLTLDGFDFGAIDPSHVRFGSEVGDTLAGEDRDDYLFGAGGADTLVGEDGDDYLEGGWGDDRLEGGKGHDTLLGMGGADTYVIRSGGAGDIIVDGSGDGTVVFVSGDGVSHSLNGGHRVGGTNIWESEDKFFKYSKIVKGDGTFDLVVYYGGETITIRDFHDGDLGITLEAFDLLPPPQTTTTIYGDISPTSYDQWGNPIGSSAPGRDDVLYDTPDADRIEALGGNDIVSMREGGADVVLLGDGSDVLWSILGNDSGGDTIQGQAGRDRIVSGSGDDWIWADQEGDLEQITASGETGIGTGAGEWIDGQTGDDSLIGSSGNDAVWGGGGNDMLIGGTGDDNMGGDWYSTQWVNETWTIDRSTTVDQNGVVRRILVFGDSGADPHSADGGNDVMYGGAGNDWMSGGVGNDYLSGGIDDDTIFGDEGADVLIAGNGNDILVGDGYGIDAANSGNDHLEGGSGDDQLKGNGGSDQLFGGDGDDTLLGEDFTSSALTGDDYIDGGNGNDLAWGGRGQDTILGGAGNDTLSGEEDADVLRGGDGNDLIAGGLGNDILEGGDGNDQLQGADGDDALIGEDGDDTLVGEAGRDLLDAGGGSDSVSGGEGNDQIMGGSEADHLFGDGGNDQIDGGTGDDFLQGGDGNDVLDGGAGKDQLLGEAGADTLAGGQDSDLLAGDIGMDQLSGGSGNDELQGGADNDVLDGGADNDLVFGQDGDDTLAGGTGDDQLQGGDGVDLLSGGDGNDTVIGDAGNDTLNGDQGRDALAGGVGNDSLAGGSDDDTLFGQAGDDTLAGDGGNDILQGDGGADTYVFGRGNGKDVIYNYESNGGSIDILQFASDVRSTDVVAYRDGLDQVYAIRGTDDSIRVKNYYVANAHEWLMEQVKFADGTIWTASTTPNFVQARLGGGTTSGTSTTNDVFAGTEAGDTFAGSYGSDTYLWDRRSGRDAVVDVRRTGDVDTIRVDSSISASDVIVLRSGDDAVLQLRNSPDAMVIRDGAASWSGEFRVVFESDGTVWTLSSVLPSAVAQSPEQSSNVSAYEATTTDASQAAPSDDAPAAAPTAQAAGSSVTGTSGNDNLQGTSGDDFIYGLGGNDTLSGLAGNDTLDGGAGTDSLVGGLGDDVFLVDSTADSVVEVAGEGTDTIQTSVTLAALAANVENLTLTGTSRINGTGNALSNVLVGNTANNSLSGGAGDDTLSGGGGTDTLTGGAGNDYYVIDDTRDVITENASDGTDTVEASFNYTLLANFENLAITGTATTATGNAAVNMLTGNALDNTLSGAAGADTMAGRAGNDLYVVENSADVIVESFGEGTDTVQSSVSYSLAAEVENLTLTGTVAINATGNALANVLTGNSAANVLTGEAGDDTYVVTAGDTIVENSGAGTDTVQSAATYTLAANIENLVLTGSTAINGTGNALDNVLTGNSAANVLTGGAGNDTFVVGTGDTVMESASEGADTVQSSVAWTLGANIENLVLTGTGAINGTGNAQANVLTGNSAANVLTGGAGDDIYMVGAGDTLVESIGEGTDTAQSAVTFTLGANVENLILTGTAAINGTGNAQANTITGNGASNTLDGGAGADTLVGGLGDDTYVIDNVGDAVVEASGEGTDTVHTSFSYVSGGNVENITLLGAGAVNATGDAINNVLTGNTGSNVLTGLGGDDTLNGGGGSDTLIGGVGNDTYVLTAGATMIENANEGIDTVQTASTYTLVADFENATLTGTAAANLTGNELANVLTGNSAANVLDATGGGNDTVYGGAGNDTLIGEYGDEMHGGAGDDHYVFTGGAFTAVSTSWEYGSGASGIDSVTADFSMKLYDYSYWSNVDSSVHYVGSMENATLVGTGNFRLDGHDGNNVLTGNSGNNIIIDRRGVDRLDGGAGNDQILGSAESTMIGGLGDDRLELWHNSISASLQGGQGDDYYYLDYGTGSVSELSGEGFDTVEVSNVIGGTYTLGANIEKLVIWGGTGNGNALDNVISGSGTLNGLAGNDTFDGSWSSGVATMYGGTGDDTFLLGIGDIANESANEGIDTVQASFTYALGANLENLTLAGTNAINGTGNALANVLIANSAANVLTGGAGNDTYIVGYGYGDTVVENANEGVDSVHASTSYSLVTLANVENLELTGTFDLAGSGNAANNLITGNAGANTLDGGVGVDTLRGGAGNDTYIVDNTADVVTENVAEGVDIVQSSVTYTLSANVESLVLTGTGQINGTGNAMDNTLTGNAAANMLIGGQGNDTYVGADAADTVVEAANEGIDTVQASISYTLGANVENLVLTNSGSVNGTGNALANTLTGNFGANILAGGTGDDTYVVGTGDSVIESANEGIDTVRSNSNWTLGANIENLVLLSSALTATGNALNNAITGNSNANTINGGGGADTLAGGTGDDTYIVDSAGDFVIENASEGVDTVQSSVTRVLEANVENLVLTGSDAIEGTGNALANALTGNTASNQLSGGEGNDTIDGGAGNDTMAGGVGDDVYVVSEVSDVVTEAAGEGTDTVRTALNNFILGVNVENLTLIGAGLLGTGNALNNVLTSQTSNADILIGGAGDDTYYVGIEDTVQENADEGVDGVITSATYTLDTSFENLTLTGSAAVSGTGNDLDNVITGNAGANVLTGGSGNDTYYVGAGDSVVESVDEGVDTLHSSVTRTLEANVENLVLTGTTAINGYGNAADNLITGSAGNNTLDGRGGADTLAGGAGDDTYTVYATDVAVVENVGEGSDLVVSTIDYTLGANIENLQLGGVSAINGNGNELNNKITGSVADNVLMGASGDDTLDGSMGADTLIGGVGDDTYDVDSIGDVVIENVGEGSDTVRSRRDYTLGANLENLTLAGYAAVAGTGNALNNVITGSVIGNVIDGGGGADTMRGGAGDDIYFVDDLYDVVDELAGANEGNDTVKSAVNYTLGSEVENLVLLGSAALSGTGNSGANRIVGNNAGNVLNGAGGDDTLDGGLGADTLMGGSGRDTFYVDDAADVVSTDGQLGDGDTVISSVNYTLGADIENLRLAGSAVAGTGNAYTNVIVGNAADNVLDGAAAADSLIGGLGNDVYLIDNTNDWVAEYEGEGFDEAQASVSVALAENIEVLTLTGTTSLSGTGNSQANLMRGNAGDNSLDGGSGADILLGGDGADTLTPGADNGAADGGSGSDVLVGGGGADLLAGGNGADTLSLGTGADVVAFNLGDGADAVSIPAGSGEHNDAVSLGGVRYADLRLAREGDDLLVKVAGTADSLRLQGWYAASGNQTVAHLQMVVDTTTDYQPMSGDALRDAKVKIYDFAALVSGFDAQWSTNPTIGDWALSDAAFGVALLSSSDTTAIGGNLAWRYAHDGNLAGVAFQGVQPQMSHSDFGMEAQDIESEAPLAATMLGATERDAALAAPEDGALAPPSPQEAPTDNDSPAAPMIGGSPGNTSAQTTAMPPTQPSNETQEVQLPVSSADESGEFGPIPTREMTAEQFSIASSSPAPTYSLYSDSSWATTRDLWLTVDAWSALEQALVVSDDFGVHIPSESLVLSESGAGAGLSEHALALQGSAYRIESVTNMKVAQL